MSDLRPTPETDAHLEATKTSPGPNLWASAEFTRKLERERDSAKTLNRSLLDQLEAKDAQIKALHEATAIILAREAEHVLSKDRISKRAEAIRCELVEKDKQLEAIREAYEALSQIYNHGSGSEAYPAQKDDHPDYPWCVRFRKTEAALAKLKPLLP